MKNLVKVEMLVDTNFGGQRLCAGNKTSVSEEVGQRWAKRGIAKLISEASSDTSHEVKDPSKMTAKQLFDLCVASGIEVAPRLDKESYLKALSEHQSKEA